MSCVVCRIIYFCFKHAFNNIQHKPMVKNPTQNIPAALFEDDKKSALQAISMAQFIAFSPYVFQASILLRDKGILSFIESSRAEGCLIEAVAEHTQMSSYAARVLMEAGLGIGLLHRKDGRYFLSKTGHIFLNHALTRINTDFMRDVCYDGAQDLEQSLKDGKPRGLRHLGDWETIYQGLSILPEPANSSWFAFDHYYSDNAFPEALSVVFEQPVTRLLDIGGNTGKWALACFEYNKEVTVGIVDLPVQLNVARKNIDAAGFGHRITYHAHNILEQDALPAGYDVMWMSQFLDCFADNEIIFILKKCYDALPANGRIFINETFWDRQRFEASAFSLQMTSLYFTTMANGNSQMYDSEVYMKLIGATGFEVVRKIDNVGLSHTILELRKK
jgi:ubiquinone/menaquinone biosynthesis C-methylase UbiE